MQSQLETLKARGHDVNFWDVSDPEHEDFVSRYNIEAVPVVVFELNGEEVCRIKGWASLESPYNFETIINTVEEREHKEIHSVPYSCGLPQRSTE